MVKPECHLWGKNFSPNLLRSISGIVIKNSNEPNEIGSKGKFKNIEIPYGSCALAIPDFVKSNRITWMAEFIAKHKSEFLKAGATEITYWIFWHGNQGNMEFTNQELKKITQTGVPLCIDYINTGS